MIYLQNSDGLWGCDVYVNTSKMTINIVHQPHTCMFCIKSTCIEPVLQILDRHRHFNCRKTSYMCTSFALIFFTYFPRKHLAKFSIYSNKFFHNFQLSESSFTCSRLQASGLAWRLCTHRSTCIKWILKFVDSHRQFL